LLVALTYLVWGTEAVTALAAGAAIAAVATWLLLSRRAFRAMRAVATLQADTANGLDSGLNADARRAVASAMAAQKRGEDPMPLLLDAADVLSSRARTGPPDLERGRRIGVALTLGAAGVAAVVVFVPLAIGGPR
jgi:hypothetical protein